MASNTSTNGTILITGGTGTVGSRIATILNAAGTPCVVASRSGKSVAGVPGVRLDWADRSTWEPALATIPDLRAVYIVMPAIVEARATAAEFLDLVLARFGNGGKNKLRFVLQSASAIDEGGPFMGGVHALLRERGERGELGWAVLRPSWFQHNFITHHSSSIKTENKIYSATGPGRVPFVSADDIAEVAVHALTADKSPDCAYLVLGPEELSYSDVAATLTSVLGRTITHRNLTADELTERFLAAGLPSEYAPSLAAMDTAIRDGAEEGLGAGHVLEVTGHPPRSFRSFVEEHRDVWTSIS